MESLAGGDHLGCFPNDETACIRTQVIFLCEGLKRGETCIAIGGVPHEKAFLDIARECGYELPGSIPQKRLSITDAKELQGSRGIRSYLDEHACNGSVQRIAVDVQALHCHDPDADITAACRFFDEELCWDRSRIVLCIFNRQLIAERDMLLALDSHPHLIINDSLTVNPYCLPANIKGGDDSESDEVCPPLDISRALEEFDGDRMLLMKLLKGFTEIVRSQITVIRKAISVGNMEVVRREAHSIKGGAANLLANKLSESALELEKQASTGVADGSVNSIDRLEKEFLRLESFASTL